MSAWIDQALALITRGEPAALITLTDVKGSAPREAGVRMLVWRDGQAGTIGGGNLEFMLTHEARALIAGEDDVSEHDYPLGPVLGQCCGGRVTARVERLGIEQLDWLRELAVDADKRRAPLYLFGAGHVGQVVARAAAPLPFALNWLETRPEYAGEALLCDDPRHAVENAPPRSLYLVLTHNHDLDYEIVRAVLARGDARYCGLIGSKSKRARFARQLRADGFDDAALRGLTCPIGGSIGLRGKAPEIIAVATVAELLLVLEAQPVSAETAHAG